MSSADKTITRARIPYNSQTVAMFESSLIPVYQCPELRHLLRVDLLIFENIEQEHFR